MLFADFLPRAVTLLVCILMFYFFSLSNSDQLKRHYNLGQYYLEVDLQDLTSFDEQLADKLTKSPAEFLPLVSKIAIYLINLVQVRFAV